MTNWAEYNEALRQRGDVTVWFSEDAVSGWSAERSGKRGAQQRYSNLAIETCLTLRVVFGLPLRQTQGFVRSLLRLMERVLPVPDYSTLCRRAQTLEIVPDTRTASGPDCGQHRVACLWRPRLDAGKARTAKGSQNMA